MTEIFMKIYEYCTKNELYMEIVFDPINSHLLLRISDQDRNYTIKRIFPVDELYSMQGDVDENVRWICVKMVEEIHENVKKITKWERRDENKDDV